jgi:ABC-2 type transport system ATP-binding protein
VIASSLTEARELIFAVLDASEARDVAEIGTNPGHFTRMLAERARDRGGRVLAVEPVPDAEMRKVASDPLVDLVAGAAPRAFDDLDACDAYVLDGDANYWTVRSSLERAQAAADGAGKPLLAIVHHSGWPWGRRDVYLNVSPVPPEGMNPRRAGLGVLPDTSQLVRGGWSFPSSIEIAETDGGPRNGVLTAVEDFVAETSGLRLVAVAPLLGFAFVYAASARWAPAVAAVLERYESDPLLERLERERVELFVELLGALGLNGASADGGEPEDETEPEADPEPEPEHRTVVVDSNVEHVSDYAVIDIKNLRKTFRIPRNQINTLKERALHPFQRAQFDELEVLRGVSFQVAQGEFFGIVGRNGSGKSTLLKCLAGIYRHDQGTINVAGRLAPFIELGVGFNPDLTARENVIINAVMMGISVAEARRRFDDVIAFAELEAFLDLKLKNYSSGMQVRLAFSVMIQADADVMLIDEVLAVGDAAFQQKCLDVFYRLRAEGKTIVLVTHDMATVEKFCHRAMFIKDGRIDIIGDPHEVGQAYLEENFARRPHGGGGAIGKRGSITEVWVESGGERVDAISHGSDIQIHAAVLASEEVDRPRVTLWLENEEGTRIFVTSTEDLDGADDTLAPGEIAHVRVDMEAPLADGHYYVGCSLTRGPAGEEPIAIAEKAVDFVMYGGERVYGLVALDHRIVMERARERVA